MKTMTMFCVFCCTLIGVNSVVMADNSVANKSSAFGTAHVQLVADDQSDDSDSSDDNGDGDDNDSNGDDE